MPLVNWEGIQMAFTYEKLWKLKCNMNMSDAELKREANIASHTLTKIRWNEPVSLFVLDKLCTVFDCDFGDLITHIPGNNDASQE